MRSSQHERRKTKQKEEKKAIRNYKTKKKHKALRKYKTKTV